MAMNSVPSASVQAKSRALLEIRADWSVIRDKATGQRRIVMPSLTNDGHVYYVETMGKACSCKAGQHGLMCGHKLAAIEAANRDALESWLIEMAAPIEPKTADRPQPIKTYEELYCAEPSCDDPPKRGSKRCRRHAPNLAAF
jgi:hypothetical protein